MARRRRSRSRPDGKFAYVANTASDSVSVITVSSNAVSKTIAAVGDSPTDVALGAGKAYVSNLDGTVAIISTSTNTVAGRVTVGAPVKSLALGTPDGGLLLAAGTNDTVAAIDTASNAVVSTLITDPTPDTASSPNLAVAANGIIYQTDNSDNRLRAITLEVVSTTVHERCACNRRPDRGHTRSASGEVTGTIVASDADGDDLTYAATSCTGPRDGVGRA